eukprot:TRINITY_DN26794_c0_g1_i1.p1 TRINITY_DN26794_c0_g1~~TRINITY_DN26794_c0_g1_i1.p1  ORF type:complete len:553 (+),score=100.39 TRINITY_DN26794_c0_g1_i1:177-1835(+)
MIPRLVARVKLHLAFLAVDIVVPWEHRTRLGLAAASAGDTPTCLAGIPDRFGRACCPRECGTCGGSGCELRPGGAQRCCGHAIRTLCDGATGQPPCVYSMASEELSFPPNCFDDQFTYDLCCFEPEVMPMCFLGEQGAYEQCCPPSPRGVLAAKYPQASYSSEEALCTEFLVSPQRSTARSILGAFYDLPSLCSQLLGKVRAWDDGPLMVVGISDSHLHLLDNFLSILAAHHFNEYKGLTIDALVIFCFDGRSSQFCREYATSRYARLRVACVEPVAAYVVTEGESPAQFRDSIGYYSVNWIKAAAPQLLLDLGASAALWADVDIVFARPLLKGYFSPTLHQLQVECEGVQLDGGPAEFAALGGLGFVARPARWALEAWLAFYEPPERRTPGRNEMYALRELPDAYRCFGINEFTRAPLMRTPLSNKLVSMHFWITGQMWNTVPSSVTDHVSSKVFKMKELGVWRPKFSWGPERELEGLDAPHLSGDWCRSGILDRAGDVCCSASCGACGGTFCDQRPGGAAHCCGGSIEAVCKNVSGPPPCRYEQSVSRGA